MRFYYNLKQIPGTQITPKSFIDPGIKIEKKVHGWVCNGLTLIFNNNSPHEYEYVNEISHSTRRTYIIDIMTGKIKSNSSLKTTNFYVQKEGLLGIHSINNFIFLFYENEFLIVAPIKTLIYREVCHSDLKSYEGYNMECIFYDIVSMRNNPDRDVDNFPSADQPDGEDLIRVHLKDGIVDMPKKRIYAFRSTILHEMAQEGEDIQVFFEDYTSNEFEYLFFSVWRAHEAKQLTTLHMLNSKIYWNRLKSLYRLFKESVIVFRLEDMKKFF